MKKIIALLACLLLLTSCSKNNNEDIPEFQALYGVDSKIVADISYDEFNDIVTKTGVIFIGGDTKSAKELAEIFCDSLCECDVNKAHFINKKNVDEKKLKELFEVDSLEYPIIVAYKNGELIDYYDVTTETEDVNKYIYDLIMAVYPTVCTETC